MSEQLIEQNLMERDQSLLPKLYRCFMLAISALCFIFGILYWIRLIGIYPGADWRVDLMSPPWQVLTVVLAVIYPVASCGLWLGSRWGIILWLIAALTETICLTIYAKYFTFSLITALLHLTTIAVFIAIIVAIYKQKRQQKTPNY